MKYTVDHLTGSRLVPSGKPERAVRNYSNHRTLAGARRSCARLQRGARARFVVIDNTTDSIVAEVSP